MHHRSHALGRRLSAGVAAIAAGALVALGAAPASAAPNLDPDALGSITVHKLEQPAELGVRNDGTAVDTTGLSPLAGVEFTVRAVESIDLSSNDGWAMADGLTAAAVLADDDAYPLGAPVVRTTSALDSAEPGTAVFGDLPIGVYLVTETAPGANAIALPAQPFLVSIPQALEGDDWLYDVHVYPKNSLIDVAKSVADLDAAGLGDLVAWTIDTTVPHASEGSTLSSFVIADQLSVEQLAFVSASVTLDGVALTDGDEYELTEVDGAVSIAFTLDGLALLNAAGGQVVSVELTTEVIAIGDGSIENTATVYVNDPSRSNGFDSNEIVSHWGAIEITKEAAGASTELLDGAIFEVYDADGALVTVDGQTRFTTVDGTVVIPGLRTEPGGVTYTLREVEAPLGYVLAADSDYEITVLPSSLAAPNTITIENAQAPAFQLPITGGDGQLAFMIAGGGLLAAALGALLVIARRRSAAQH